LAGKNRFDQARLINIANFLTTMRLLLAPLFVYLLLASKEKLALVVFMLCGLTDGLDGILARRLRQRTILGAYLDPIADKFLIAAAFIVLSYLKIVPLWLTVLVISRDIFIVVGSTLYLMLVDHTDIRPTLASKVNTVVQILSVFYFLTYAAFPELPWFLSAWSSPLVASLFIWLCAATTAISGAQYLLMGIKALSHEP